MVRTKQGWLLSDTFFPFIRSTGNVIEEAVLNFDLYGVVASLLLLVTVPLVFILGIFKPVRK